MKTLVLLLSFFLFWGCGRTPAPVLDTPDPPRPAKLLTLQPQGDTQRMTFPALLRAQESVELAFDVPGIVEVMNVTEGRAVEQGILLAALDKRDYESRLSSATAAAELAQSELARFEQLRGSVSEAEIERRRAQATAATADLITARNALEKTELHAPFDGVVSRRLVQRHSSVQAKQPVLLFQALSPLDVIIDVPEPLMLRVKPGSGEAVDATLRFDSLPGRAFPVSFREVVTVADPVTQTYSVVFSLERPPDMTILPGMSGSLEVEGILDERDPVYLVPPLALEQPATGPPRVWVVDPEDSTVSPREVTLGRPRGAGIEVLDGVSEGEQIVVAGISQLRKGMRVRPMEDRERSRP